MPVGEHTVRREEVEPWHLLNESNTPRSYIANNLTPRSTLATVSAPELPRPIWGKQCSYDALRSKASISAASVVQPPLSQHSACQTTKQNPVDIGSDDAMATAKMQRLETEETADEAQQHPLGMQLPTVERISESPFEQSSRASSVLRVSMDKEDSSGTAPANSLRPFFSGILSRVRGESAEKSSHRAA
ncbi:hypothetical protein GQ600_15436 [Phytophthora cactorum]|nr:hypothetical protein GQ600_15436 [Phytophthora cactorum]